jgi:hypothetical protein
MSHRMDLVVTLDGGIDVFKCRECERILAVTYPPNYKKVVIIAGAEMETHNAGNGGLTITDARIDQDDEDTDQWEQFLDDMNFDELWNTGGEK